MDTSYDLICIGAGGAGIACARRARRLGAKVALIERKLIGGTCLNRGCFPMKLIDTACELCDEIDLANDIGVMCEKKGIDWTKLKEKFHEYIKKVNTFHLSNCKNDGVVYIEGNARFTDSKNVIEVVDSEGKIKATLTATHIVICSGSKPLIPKNISGLEHAIGTDEFFELDALPKSVAIVGADPIGAELACMLFSLGVKTVICTLDPHMVRAFDQEITDLQMNIMRKSGIQILTGVRANKIERTAEKSFVVNFENHPPLEAELVLRSLGRVPNYEGLELAKAGVKINPNGRIEVDEFDNTSAPGIYAIGDANGKLMLAPIAISAGRCLAMRLFAGKKDSKVSYDVIPSVVFTHPPMARCGLTEEQAVQKYGKDKLKIYRKQFDQIHYAMTDKKVPSMIKLVCLLPEEKILGIHALGRGMDEAIQGFAVAVKMGACKKDLDSTLGIHITVSEEFLNLL